MAAGASPDASDFVGDVPLHFAAQHPIRLPVLKLLLERAPQVVNQVGGAGRTPLMVASDSKFAEGVRLLLEHGADPTIADIVRRPRESKRSSTESAAERRRRPRRSFRLAKRRRAAKATERALRDLASHQMALVAVRRRSHCNPADLHGPFSDRARVEATGRGSQHPSLHRSRCGCLGRFCTPRPGGQRGYRRVGSSCRPPAQSCWRDPNPDKTTEPRVAPPSVPT